MKTRSSGSFSPGEEDMSAYQNEQLVLEAMDDSHLAFEQLIEQYQYRVLRTIASIISDRQAVQDVAQDTFLAAWKGLPKLKSSHKFGGWLNGIAINLSKRWLRDEWKYRENTDSLEGSGVVLPQETRYQQDKLRQEIWDAIDGLSVDHREAVILHYISGYSHKEIGQMLSVPSSTVHGRLQQAKNQLRKEFLDMVTQLQLEIDSTVHRFLKEHAKQDGVSVEGLILRLIEIYKRDTDSPEIAVRKVSSDTWEARPSPDGRYIAMTNWETFNLAVRDLTTGEIRDITDEGSHGPGPHRIAWIFTWSPDSKHIAYVWNNEGYNELRIVGLDGLKPRVLWSEDGKSSCISPYDWSQDGKFIVGGSNKVDGFGEIVLVSVADGSMQTLKSLEGHLPKGKRVNFSPDGRYVTYARSMEKDGTNDVFLLATDGTGEELRLEGHADSNDEHPVWAPDGKSIVSVCNRDPVGSTSLWLTLMADGKQTGDPQLIMKCAGYIYPQGFTQESSLYYGVQSVPVADIYVASMNMETGEVESQPTRLRCEGNNGNPVWSPDGKSLAYMSVRHSPKMAQQAILVIRSIETGKEREIHPETAMYHRTRLRWSPDGRSILCSAVCRDPHVLLDVQTGHIAAMVKSHSGMEILYPEWSRDGKTIFYIRRHRHPDDLEYSSDWSLFSIVAHDLATGEERELYTGRHTWAELSVSPDGQELAFSGGYQNALTVIPTAGGEPRILYGQDWDFQNGRPIGHPDWVATVTWTPDGRHLLFIRSIRSLPDGEEIPRDEWIWELCRIPAEGGEPKILRKLEQERRPHGFFLRGESASFHPDGQSIAFARADGESQSEIWVMDNLLTTFSADK